MRLREVALFSLSLRLPLSQFKASLRLPLSHFKPERGGSPLSMLPLSQFFFKVLCACALRCLSLSALFLTFCVSSPPTILSHCLTLALALALALSLSLSSLFMCPRSVSLSLCFHVAGSLGFILSCGPVLGVLSILFTLVSLVPKCSTSGMPQYVMFVCLFVCLCLVVLLSRSLCWRVSKYVLNIYIHI